MRIGRIVVVLVGCTVGPSYHRPPAPVPRAPAYKEAWKLASPADGTLRGEWWKMFREPELDALMARLLIDNQTIKQAFASYMAARAQIGVVRAQYFPTITANPSATRLRSSATFARVGSGSATGVLPTSSGAVVSGGGVQSLYSLPVEISWAPDLFGRVRNAVHQAQYAAQVSAADLENQKLIEQATLVQLYYEIRGYDALADILEATIKTDEQILELARSRFATGVDTEIAVVQADEALQTAIVQAKAAALLRAGYEHAIATLLGIPATSFSMPHRPLLVAPPPIPTGVPSQLLERRPDIAAAERQMAAANAEVGIGYAAYYPTLTLSGTAGFASGALDTLLSWPSRVWSLGANVAHTFFDGGARHATIDQAIATYHANVAAYRQTVLTAFQQVEDFLSQTRIVAEEVVLQKRVVELAQRAFELETTRYVTGIDPFLDLMTQQNLLLAARQTLVNLQVQHMTATVMLIQALGGGWDRAALRLTSSQ